MADPRGLAKHLEHVMVAEAVERVATVVARHGDAHATLREFVQERDAAPARRAAGDSILQIEAAHRQAHHADAGLGGEIHRLPHGLWRLRSEAAAVTSHELGPHSPPEHRTSDVGPGPRA